MQPCSSVTWVFLLSRKWEWCSKSTTKAGHVAQNPANLNPLKNPTLFVSSSDHTVFEEFHQQRGSLYCFLIWPAHKALKPVVPDLKPARFGLTEQTRPLWRWHGGIKAHTAPHGRLVTITVSLIRALSACSCSSQISGVADLLGLKITREGSALR